MRPLEHCVRWPTPRLPLCSLAACLGRAFLLLLFLLTSLALPLLLWQRSPTCVASLPPLSLLPDFHPARELKRFVRPAARAGLWRAAGSVAAHGSSVRVGLLSAGLAGSAEHSGPDRMRLVGVMPLLGQRLRATLLSLVTRRDFVWSRGRHRHHPTTDQQLYRFPLIDARVSALLQSRLMPGLAAVFGVQPSQLLVHDAFFVKYEPGAKLLSADMRTERAS